MKLFIDVEHLNGIILEKLNSRGFEVKPETLKPKFTKNDWDEYEFDGFEVELA
jgi:hypothetical protein